jgi:hypothetical protein
LRAHLNFLEEKAMKNMLKSLSLVFVSLFSVANVYALESKGTEVVESKTEMSPDVEGGVIEHTHVAYIQPGN